MVFLEQFFALDGGQAASNSHVANAAFTNSGANSNTKGESSKGGKVEMFVISALNFHIHYSVLIHTN